jgi:hypothetical protein
MDIIGFSPQTVKRNQTGFFIGFLTGNLKSPLPKLVSRWRVTVMRQNDFGATYGRFTRFGPASLILALIFLGACSRREEQSAPKPVVFFAPATITNVPDLYKPLYLGNLTA